MRHKSKSKSVRSLKRQLDKVFSLWVRDRDRKICFTCGRPGNQAGHFISRAHNSTRYDEINTNAQCISCNIFQHGNHAEYAYRLIQKYGRKRFEQLIKKGREIKQFKAKELEALIERYRERIEAGSLIQQDPKTM